MEMACRRLRTLWWLGCLACARGTIRMVERACLYTNRAPSPHLSPPRPPCHRCPLERVKGPLPHGSRVWAPGEWAHLGKVRMGSSTEMRRLIPSHTPTGDALIAIYEALGGEHWLNNANWNISKETTADYLLNDPCNRQKRWYGVGCMDPCERYLDDVIGTGAETQRLTAIRGSGEGCFAGRITTLNLRRNNLTGHLNLGDLGELRNLTYLDLSFNQLSGSIPTQIGRIDNLQMMNLAHNELSGTLPSELGALNSGAPPVSMGCGLDDPCPLGVQLRLTELNLAHNRIEGGVPTELGKLESLKVFLFAHAPISPVCRNPLFPYLTF